MRSPWRRRAGAAVVLLIMLLACGINRVDAQEGSWGFGTDVGFITGTENNTVFALNLQADYYVAKEFSIGPMVQLAPVGDLTRYAFAGAMRYHFRIDQVNIVPFAGVGFLHDDLNKGSIDRNDTSYWIPIGMTFEYQVSPKLALANTVMVNLHNIDMSPSLPRDTTSVTVLFGLRFGP